MAIFLIVIFLLKLQIKDGLFNFTFLQKYSTNELSDFVTITFFHYIQHITLHKKLVCLAIANLKYEGYNNFYQLLLLLSGYVTVDPWPVQIHPDENVNICELLNKKNFHFLHINLKSFLSKVDELKFIFNKTKAVSMG